MNRRSLIKSLFTIAVTPKMLSEFNLGTPTKKSGGILLNNLRTMEPVVIEGIDCNELINNYKHKEGVSYFWYEKGNNPMRLNIETCQNTY